MFNIIKIKALLLILFTLLALTGCTTETVDETVDETADSNITDVNATNQTPIANAGSDQNITFGEYAIFNASSSSDDGYIVSYVWDENGTELNSNIAFVKNDFSVGTHTITLTVTDNQGATKTDKVVVAVKAQDEATNQTPTADAGSDQNITFREYAIFNASSSSDDGYIVTYVWDENGTELNSSMMFIKNDVTPGTHTLTLTVTDNQGATNTDEVVITVNAPVVVNQTPTADAGENQIVTVGDTVTLDAGSSSDDGTIESYAWSENTTQLSAEMSFTKSDFTVGTHTITLTVTDNQGATATDEVIISVNSLANLVPVAEALSVTTRKNRDLNITLNASDGDATDSLTYSVVSNPIHGTLSAITDKNITYTPNANYSGSDIFIYKVNDETVDSNIARVDINVTNQKPVASALSVTTYKNISLNITLSGSDEDNDTLIYVVETSTTKGAIIGILDDKITYTPNANFIGTDSFTYKVNDGTDDSATVTVDINVTPITHNDTNYEIVTSPYTQKIWLDRNLGASRVCTALDDTACYGDYYQWGRNRDGHEKSNSATTSTQAININSAGTNFIKSSYTYSYDWAQVADLSGALRNLNWSKTDGTLVCPTGFRVPTITELEAETISASTAVTNNVTAFNNFLKLPSAGYRDYSNGSVVFQGSLGIMWSVSFSGSRSINLNFDDMANNGSSIRAVGFSVRCLKD